MQAQIGHPVTSEQAAGFWRRFGGAFVDGLVVGVVGFVFQVALGRSLGELVSLALGALYFTWFHGRTGQTPGNAALGIRVVDADTGEAIGYQRALVRWAVSLVSYAVVFLGFLWMLWDPRRQTWHDKAAGSLPITVR